MKELEVTASVHSIACRLAIQVLIDHGIKEQEVVAGIINQCPSGDRYDGHKYKVDCVWVHDHHVPCFKNVGLLGALHLEHCLPLVVLPLIFLSSSIQDAWKSM